MLWDTACIEPHSPGSPIFTEPEFTPRAAYRRQSEVPNTFLRYPLGTPRSGRVKGTRERYSVGIESRCGRQILYQADYPANIPSAFVIIPTIRSLL